MELVICHTMKRIYSSERRKYNSDAPELAEAFIPNIEYMCTHCSNVCKGLDRINTHRLLKLYIYTILLFRYAIFLCDMTSKSNN